MKTLRGFWGSENALQIFNEFACKTRGSPAYPPYSNRNARIVIAASHSHLQRSIRSISPHSPIVVVAAAPRYCMMDEPPRITIAAMLDELIGIASTVTSSTDAIASHHLRMLAAVVHRCYAMFGARDHSCLDVVVAFVFALAGAVDQILVERAVGLDAAVDSSTFAGRVVLPEELKVVICQVLPVLTGCCDLTVTGLWASDLDRPR